MVEFVQRDAAGLRLPRLSAALGREEYLLHLAALEWSLDSPILIQGEDDLESKRFWRDRVKPFEHQIRNLITFCRRAPVALIADDVGLGKTVSAGLIVSELIARRKVSRAIVVCPKMLLPQWAEEIRSKFGIDALGESGAPFRSLVRSSVPVVITTYQTTRAYFGEIRDAGFDMIILDEAHKLRNLHGTTKPPEFAVTVQQALRDRVFKYVLMLTATPIQNRLWDLYSLIDLLAIAKGHPNPLGSKGDFVARYLQDGSTKAVQLYPGRQKEFRDHLSNYMVRTRRGDAQLMFPERQVCLVRAPASDVEAKLLALISDLFHDHELNGLAQSSIAQALMSSPEALCSQLQNMAANGNIPDDYAHRARVIAGDQPTTGKLTCLANVILELREKRPIDWRLVVFTTRRETQEAIGTFLQKERIRFGFIRGGAARENGRVIKEFWREDPGLRVIVSTDAGAEGINLQVANVLVNYDLPWNPMIVEQRIGRIQRLAAKHAYVNVLNLVVGGSVEEHVVGRLSEKLQAISESIGDIESVLESAGGGIDTEEGVEAAIRRLVVSSLLGQDVEAAMRKAADSIERGKRVFDEERETVEQTIGALNTMHRTGPRMPTIKPLVPTVPYQEFVRRALTADGCTLVDRDDQTVDVRRPGRPIETIAFSEEDADRTDAGYRGVFTQQGPRLYRPGKPAFERLAQSWIDRHEARVIHLGKADEARINELAAEWTKKIEGAEITGVFTVKSEASFQGELVCRANAAVAHDKLERLVVVSFCPDQHPRVTPVDSDQIELSNEEINPEEITGETRDLVASALGADPDLAEFCRFYRERLKEELVAAGAHTDRQGLVRNQFTPKVVAEAVAVNATRYDIVTANVVINLMGGRYETPLSIIPALGRVACGIPIRTCEKSARSVPETWLECCSVSKTVGLRHLFEKSDESDRFALPELMLKCEFSGRRILPDESGKSDVSERVCAKSLLSESAVSGRRGLPDELVRCEFSNALVLATECESSGLSGKRFRTDERAESLVSGMTGHRDEFIKSDRPRGFLAPAEAGRSDMSGDIGPLTSLERSDRSPHRKGFRNEFAICEASGQRLLRDELSASDVSGKIVDKALLIRSGISAKVGLESELITCERSALVILPSEAAKCEVSGKMVCSHLLKHSEVSGRAALESFLVRCEVTKKLVLPDEVERCHLTGILATRSELETCCVSGRRMLRSRMTRSVASNKWFWSRTEDGLPKSADAIEWPSCEIVTCAWLDGPMLANESATCKLSHLQLANTLINTDGESTILRGLLCGWPVKPRAVHISGDILHWLRSNFSEFARAKDGEMVSSPSGRVGLVCCRISAGFLGMRSQFVGAAVGLSPPMTLLCRPLVGRRTGNYWVPVVER